MDQIKIGKFISLKRKEKNITQKQLAEKLNITDRAVSKWENGISMPDAGLISELCEILDITVNDLFCGEIVDEKDSERKLKENLLEIVKIKEARDKELLFLEIFIAILVSIIMFGCIFIASFVTMADWLRIILIIIGIIPFALGICWSIRLEQIAGYYQCNKCKHKYIPSFYSVLFAMHVNRTRYMKCPNCDKKSWSRKVINK